MGLGIVIGDWNWGLGTAIWHWDWGLGISVGLGIEDWD